MYWCFLSRSREVKGVSVLLVKVKVEVPGGQVFIGEVFIKVKGPGRSRLYRCYFPHTSRDQWCPVCHNQTCEP